MRISKSTTWKDANHGIKKYKTSPKEETCPQCGAPINSEICQFCGAKTGIKTKDANMEYPAIECKEVVLNFWTVVFPAIFAVSFGFFGFAFPVIFLLNGATGKEAVSIILGCSIFAIIGIAAAVIMITPIIRYIFITVAGKKISGTVYGYMDDTVLMNGQPAQVVKILTQTKKGPRFLLYQLGNTTKPHKVNSKISMKVYKNYFMIIKDNDKDEDLW